ncbi:MAG: RcpC/CpaB family pilus assembly protein [Chloroflexota bacterium]|nr:RcpC/CpaB family pilus assembly protein [Chloroflexota bacterium]
MRRGSSSLLIIIGLFLLLAAGAGGVLIFYMPSLVTPADAQTLPPTPEPQVSRVKAELDIQAGTVLTTTEGFLSTEMVPASQFMAGVHLSSVEEARDMVATGTISASEPVRKDQLRKAGLAQKMPAPKEGEAPVKAFPVQVNSLSGVADLVQPGDFVDVLASFNLDVATFTPGAPAAGEQGTTQSIIERPTNEGATKVLLQDVQVLDVIKPAPPQAEASAAPQPEGPPSEADPAAPVVPPTAGNTLNPGQWVFVIAVTNQEAEVLRFALDRGIGITTILRRAGDHTTERTVGATMRILVDNYGMPMPSFPQVIQQPAGVKLENVPELPQVKTPAFAPTVTTNP